MEHLHFSANFASRLEPFLEQWHDRMDPGLVALVMGVVAILLFHILVNVGMVVGMMPVTGIPLPLMSYGGSSVLFMFLALGIVMNIRMRRFVN